MMYGAFAEQRGIDPREYYRQALAETPASSAATDSALSPPQIGQSYNAAGEAVGLDQSAESILAKMDAELSSQGEAPADGAPPVLSPETGVSYNAAEMSALSRLDKLELSAYSPGNTPGQPEEAASAATPPPARKRTQSEEEMEDEMSAVREDYLMDLFTNCQTCLDPISGEKLLVADLSYTIRMLSLQERYNLRAENELANDIEDNLIFERRSTTCATLARLLLAANSAHACCVGCAGRWRRRRSSARRTRPGCSRGTTTTSARTARRSC